MLDDEPSERVRESVVIALDEADVPGWFDAWQHASPAERQRLEGDVVWAAIRRNHAEPQRREELLTFRGLTAGEDPDDGLDTVSLNPDERLPSRRPRVERAQY